MALVGLCLLVGEMLKASIPETHVDWLDDSSYLPVLQVSDENINNISQTQASIDSAFCLPPTYECMLI